MLKGKKKSIKATLIHPLDIYGGLSPESMQRAIIALRALSKVLWDFKFTVEFVNLKKIKCELNQGEFTSNTMWGWRIGEMKVGRKA